MAKIRFSRKAIADLDGIWEYTAETWSEDQAVMQQVQEDMLASWHRQSLRPRRHLNVTAVLSFYGMSS
ncbi:MAG: type II toxin-antitoxin system RelE/ParE family toxin [Bacteroidales bacterium]|nr:type II toxin-antitoxin system RelE/ParE family toxin [Bacteroidales bacterium]